MNSDYSLADLARLADVTPRTVRYYVAQGLLPSPDAAGPATRYSEGHLARLRLIRRLQRDHLPLAEIRERLEQMSDAEVVAALAMTTSTPQARTALDAAGTVDYIRNLMEQARIEPTVHRAAVSQPAAMPPAPAAGPPEQPTSARRAFALRGKDAPAPAPAVRSASMPAPMERLEALHEDISGADVARSPDDRSPSRPARSTWERVVVTPDIEIHVRRPLRPLDNKRADTLERYARELFQDEP